MKDKMLIMTIAVIIILISITVVLLSKYEVDDDIILMRSTKNSIIKNS